MLTLLFYIQQTLMIIALPTGALEGTDLMLIEATTSSSLKFLATDFLAGPLLLRRLDARLEARLHADAQRGVEGDDGGVAAQLGLSLPSPAWLLRRRRLLHPHVRLPHRLQLERPRRVSRRDYGPRLRRRHRLRCRC